MFLIVAVLKDAENPLRIISAEVHLALFFNELNSHIQRNITKIRGGSRAAATSKMERFVIIVNGFQPLTIITKRSILDVAAVLDPLLKTEALQ